MSNIELSELRFEAFDTTDIGSLALVFGSRPPEGRCGIYILRFETAEAYVGQAVDVVSRYATHRRRWGDIISVEFAPCSRESLDSAERRVVSWVEKTASLRNIMLTNAPGGWGDISVETVTGESVALPWDRARRSTVSTESSSSPLARHWKLRQRPDYGSIRSTLARYVDETIADPVLTTAGLWTLTALPSTSPSKGWRRLVTLNCGRMETLYLGELTSSDSRSQVEWRLNLSTSVSVSQLQALPLAWGDALGIEEAGYSAGDVVRVVGIGVDTLLPVLESETVVAAAYELNTQQMRQGSRLFARYHNASFAFDVLAEAARISQR